MDETKVESVDPDETLKSKFSLELLFMYLGTDYGSANIDTIMF